MLTIRNESLEACVLDPVADRARMGGRYCWGGYCNRIRDAEGRELMSGPEFPELPSAFNGEGIPEVFRFENKVEQSFLTFDESGHGLIIGCGLAHIDLEKWSSMGEVTEPCEWQIEHEDARIRMRTQHAYSNWSYRLTRVLRLEGRTLYSETVLENTGKAFTLQWYAHPFFPLIDGLCACRFAVKTAVCEETGYCCREDGWIEMRTGYDWQKGCFEWLRREPGRKLDAEIRHPLCGSVRMRGDFPVDTMPVWANAHTLSIEPYLKKKMAAGERYSWSLKYEFDGDCSRRSQ